MIIFQDAVKSYDGRKNAIDHVSLEIRDGEIIDFKGNYEEYLNSQGIE